MRAAGAALAAQPDRRDGHRLEIIIGRGAGLAFGLRDDELPSDAILDDQAEVIVDGHSFPAVAFTIANAKDIAIHPGDAAGVCWPRSPM